MSPPMENVHITPNSTRHWSCFWPRRPALEAKRHRFPEYISGTPDFGMMMPLVGTVAFHSEV